MGFHVLTPDEKLEKNSFEQLREQVSSRLKQYLWDNQEHKTIFFVTGGRSAPLWNSIFELDRKTLQRSHFFLTDFFDEEEAKSQGRTDTNEESVYAAGLRQALTDRRIDPTQVHLPEKEGTLEYRAKKYSETLTTVCGRIPRCDVLILSAGGGEYWPGGEEDPGHVAGLRHGLQDVYDDSKATFVVVDNMPKPPRRRVSMSYALMEDAALAFTCVLGKSKENSRRNLADRNLSPVECPAMIANEIEGKSFVVSDLPM